MIYTKICPDNLISAHSPDTARTLHEIQIQLYQVPQKLLLLILRAQRSGCSDKLPAGRPEFDSRQR
jgi:hypothetical protein